MSPFSTSNGHDFPGLLGETVPGFATEGDDESHHEPLGNPPRESQSPQLGIIPTVIDIDPFHGCKSVRPGRCGVKRDAGVIGRTLERTWRGDLPHRRPGAFGRRRRRSPLEVDGTTAQLAPSRRAKIAAVKSVNIYDVGIKRRPARVVRRSRPG